MTRIFFLTLIFIIAPMRIFAAELELKFEKATKDQFFLINSVLDNRGVSINKQGNNNQNIFDTNLSIINFQNMNSGSQLKSKNITLMNDSHLGEKSALFYNKNSFVQFKYYGNFEIGFSIEFWIKPFTTELGKIFSTQYLSIEGPHKTLEISFEKGHIVFKFENLFVSYKDKNEFHTIKIDSTNIIPPNQWTAHKLKYDPANGQLNYYYNGTLNNQSWATDNTTSNNALLYLDIPKESQLVIGKGYRGLMDQFSISSADLDNSTGNVYEKSHIISRVFDFKKMVSITSFFSNTILPQDTGIKIEYRDSTLPFNEATPESLVPFKEYDNLSLSRSQLKSRYVQVKLTLFRDPTNFQSPLVRSIGIRYQPLETPIRPVGLKAIATKGDIIISFNEGLTRNIGAYRIYIGTKRNQYFGESDISLESPIFLPLSSLIKDPSTDRLSYSIKGLTADRLYFVRISAVSIDGIEGELSDETSVRARMM